jgi:hypothetical protein
MGIKLMTSGTSKILDDWGCDIADECSRQEEACDGTFRVRLLRLTKVSIKTNVRIRRTAKVVLHSA